MDLNKYLSQPSESLTAMAKELGTSPAYLYQMATGRRSVSIKYVKQIKEYTNGRVTEKDMRPKDWHLIWPDLKASKQPRKAAVLTREVKRVAHEAMMVSRCLVGNPLAADDHGGPVE